MQSLIYDIAFGRCGSNKKKSKRRFNWETFQIWLYSYAISMIFVVVPYVIWVYDEPVTIGLIMKDHGVPLLTIMTAFSILIESSRKKIYLGFFQIFNCFLILFSITCYFAYFIANQLNDDNLISSYSFWISVVLALMSIVMEAVFIYMNGENV